MSNVLTDVFKDVLSHTHALGSFEVVKYKNNDGITNVYAYNADQTLMLKATIDRKVDSLEGFTVGLSRMGILQGFLNYGEFVADTSTVEIINKPAGGTEIPAEVKFTSANGTTASYRFTNSAVIEQNVKDFDFAGSAYQIVLEPSDKNIKDLQYFIGTLGSYETVFTPKIEDNNLYFYIGDAASDRTKILIKAGGCNGKLNHSNSWDLATFIKLIKCGETATVAVSISNDGIIEIVVESGIGSYIYYMTAKA